MKAFRNALKTAVKLNTVTAIQISESLLRDPIYYDYLYLFITQYARVESTVLFNEAFKTELAQLEENMAKKFT